MLDSVREKIESLEQTVTTTRNAVAEVILMILMMLMLMILVMTMMIAITLIYTVLLVPGYDEAVQPRSFRSRRGFISWSRQHGS